MCANMPQYIRDELDQTPAWWDRAYRELKAKAFPPHPFDPAEHEGHDLIEIRNYSSTVIVTQCTACPPEWDSRVLA